MQDTFNAYCNFLDSQLQPGEHYLAWFEAEHSNFIRFNHAAVRQAGSVKQMTLEVRLIIGNRHVAYKASLHGEERFDRDILAALVTRLRSELPNLPEDPYLLYSTDAEKSETIRKGNLPSADAAVAEITAAARGLDLVAIFASGPIERGFGSSFGARRWHETQSFNFDFSLYLAGDKAVKATYAGFDWNAAALNKAIVDASKQLAILQGPARTLNPGKYRAYLSPTAMAEIFTILSWGGFGIKSQRTRHSPFLRAIENVASLSPQLAVSENIADGITPDFEPQGFAKPPILPLIKDGKLVSALVSPRSAKEFQIASTGANSQEFPEALDVSGGQLPVEKTLERLGTGIYVNNLWYLNYSDRSSGRITGMTRFVTSWVENGEIIAPINVMRFDESIYRLLGENLEELTREREFLIDPGSYETRSTQSWRMPGALVRDFMLTL